MSLKDPVYFFSLLTILNLITYGLNIVISKTWDKLHQYKTRVLKQELYTSIITLLVNILIAIPGFLLWNMNFINFSNQNFILSFLLIFMLMDFLMYIFHYSVHRLPILKEIHGKHHEHDTEFNSVSLYYMSPWESIGLGIILTIITSLFSFNIYALIAFLFFNWFYGVITHLNVKIEKSTFFIFTTNTFHKNHHELNMKNYGFYTVLWDKIFGTDTI